MRTNAASYSRNCYDTMAAIALARQQCGAAIFVALDLNAFAAF